MKVKVIYPPKDPKYLESYEIYNALVDNLAPPGTSDDDCDFIFYILDLRIYLTGEKPHLFPLKDTLKNIDNYQKTVIIDYSDPYEIQFIPDELVRKVGWYFKRSVVNRKDGVSHELVNYSHLPLSGKIIPIHFAVRDDYLFYDSKLAEMEKKYDICCMFKDDVGGMRGKVVEVVRNRPEKVFTGIVYDSDFSQRYGIVNRGYYDIMKKSRIIVTANPSDWEGDFRLWEALLTGNLVMCDRMICNPGLVDKTHIVWYDNPEHLDILLTYYLKNPEDIGKNGKLWCLSNGLYKHRVQDIIKAFS